MSPRQGACPEQFSPCLHRDCLCSFCLLVVIPGNQGICVTPAPAVSRLDRCWLSLSLSTPSLVMYRFPSESRMALPDAHPPPTPHPRHQSRPPGLQTDNPSLLPTGEPTRVATWGHKALRMEGVPLKATVLGHTMEEDQNSFPPSRGHGLWSISRLAGTVRKRLLSPFAHHSPVSIDREFS